MIQDKKQDGEQSQPAAAEEGQSDPVEIKVTEKQDGAAVGQLAKDDDSFKSDDEQPAAATKVEPVATIE